MQIYSIIIRPEAKKDLLDIWFYIAISDLPGKADVVYDLLTEKCYSLSCVPQRGRRVPELQRLGIFGFHEIFYKSYRIIYKITNDAVVIYGIFDGRRNLRDVLWSRMLALSVL